MNKANISSTPIEQLYVQLQSSPDGLSNAVAAKKLLVQQRLNKQQSRLQREAKLLFRQFTNPLVILLVIAIVLSAFLGDASEALIILFILLATALLSFWQERNAGRTVEKMKQLIQMQHTVMREEKTIQLPTDAVAEGDVLLFDAGDIIPADCRIIESNELHVNESSLTGESFPAEKMAGTIPEDAPLNQKYNCLWQGTAVISGTAKAIAVATAGNTVFGQMAHSLVQTPETAYEKGIRHFGNFLLRITIVLSFIILGANLYLHKPFFDSILFSLALAVGMAPELLPAIMTFSMSASARHMSSKKVIVKKLSSIFNFGEVTILCTDKTGTITQGTVAIKDVLDATGAPSSKSLLYAFLNAHFQNGFTNPIDATLSALPLSAAGYSKINEIPYDFIRKRLSIAVQKDGQRFFITKGALMNVLEVCSFIETANGLKPLDDAAKEKITNDFEGFSKKGYRVLGLSYKQMETEKISRKDEQQMIFLGYILLEDPLKEDTVASINRLEQLHITIKIITGDNRFAAAHTAEKIGMQNPVILTGPELDLLPPEALPVRAFTTDIFVEIEPHQKERIVKALQKSHYTVAYMGDGINDVAAIHAADIGISTNNAVDVAKEAADFVLLEKNLSVLADGIYEGRKSFANSMKYLFITTGATFGNMFSVAGASLLLPFLPMLPKQILLDNLLTDLPFLTIASDYVEEAQLQQPRKWDTRIIRNFMIVFGLHSSIFDFITFYFLYWHFHLSGALFQTGWFLESALTELLIVFVIRSTKPIYVSRPGKLLLFTSLLAMVLIIFLPFSPFASILGFSMAGYRLLATIGLILLVYVVTADLLKLVFFRLQYRRQPA